MKLLGHEVEDKLFRVFQGRREKSTCCGVVAATVEFLGDFADVNVPPAAKRAANSAVVGFHEQGGNLNGANSLALVDEVFGVFVFGAGIFEILLGDVHKRASTIAVKLECVLHRGHQVKSLR